MTGIFLEKYNRAEYCDRYTYLLATCKCDFGIEGDALALPYKTKNANIKWSKKQFNGPKPIDLLTSLILS